MTAKQFLTYISGAPLQPAIAAALGLPDDVLRRASRRRCRPSATGCAPGCASSASRSSCPQGTYFVTTDIRPLGYDDGVAFCLALPERCGVVAIPHEVFYDDTTAGRPLVRWAFCKRDDVLDAAVAGSAALRAASDGQASAERRSRLAAARRVRRRLAVGAPGRSGTGTACGTRWRPPAPALGATPAAEAGHAASRRRPQLAASPGAAAPRGRRPSSRRHVHLAAAATGRRCHPAADSARSGRHPGGGGPPAGGRPRRPSRDGRRQGSGRAADSRCGWRRAAAMLASPARRASEPLACRAGPEQSRSRSRRTA